MMGTDSTEEADQGAGSLKIDVYLIQSNSDIGQTSCELEFGAFGGSTYTIIRNPRSKPSSRA